MKKILAICGIELSLIFKKPQNYLIMFVAPLLLTFVFGSMLSGNDDKVRLAIVDQDDTILSQHYIRRLKAHDDMYVFENMSESKASEKLKQKKIAGIIVISRSFQTQLEKGKNPEPLFRHGPELSETPMVKQYAESTLATLNIQVTAAKTASQTAGENWKAAYKTVFAKKHEDIVPAVKQQTLSDKKEGAEASDTASRAKRVFHPVCHADHDGSGWNHFRSKKKRRLVQIAYSLCQPSGNRCWVCAFLLCYWLDSIWHIASFHPLAVWHQLGESGHGLWCWCRFFC